jgi:hypothetical protein
MLPGLPFPRRDVEGLEALFIENGYNKENVIVMTRERGLDELDFAPTAEHIRNQLDLMLGQLKPGDSVIVALAGHGVMMLAPPDGDPKGEPRERSFFCPMDANLAHKKLERFIGFDELYRALKECKATVKLLLVDACRNELLAQPEGRPGGIAMPAPPPPPPSVAALFSCSDKEISWEDKDLGGGHGVFFHYVIQGLKGDADIERGNKDNKVELDELYSYVKDNVRTFVAGKHRTTQRPRLEGDIGPVVLLDVSGRRLPLEGTRAGQERDDNGLKIKFCWCPAGRFLMGSPKDEPGRDDNEGDAHGPVSVSLSHGFWMGKYEVTQRQWQNVMGTSVRDQRDKAIPGWK